MFEELRQLISSKLEVDIEKITLDSNFREDLNADSLDTYELVYALEEDLGIKIPDEQVMKFEKVKDVVNFIEANKK